MIPKEFLLVSSLKSFLFFDAFATIELQDEKELINIVKESELKEHWVRIALMKWEMHHGFQLNIKYLLELNISEIVQHALKNSISSIEDYKEHILNRNNEIEEIFKSHEWDDSDFDEETFDRDMYINNRN